ncbi:hypothetical protein Chor_010792 [Crotalus horridus]
MAARGLEAAAAASLWPAASGSCLAGPEASGSRLRCLEGRLASAEEQLGGCQRAVAELGGQLEGKWAALGGLVRDFGRLERRLERLEDLLRNRNFWILRFPPGARGETPKVRAGDYAIAKPEILTKIEQGDALCDTNIETAPEDDTPTLPGAGQSRLVGHVLMTTSPKFMDPENEPPRILLPSGPCRNDAVRREMEADYQTITISEEHLCGLQEDQCAQDPLFFGEGSSSGKGRRGGADVPFQLDGS